MKKMKGICLILAVTALLAGCGSAKTNSQAASTFTPTLDVTATVSGDTATLHIKTDLKLSKEHYDHARVTGEGHIHLSVDGSEKIIVTEPEKVLEHLSPGKHEARVSLHNNDHTPYDVGQTVTFEVK
ncbi:hypothetical protein ABE504_17980 [Paenibacillus oryzisoli]|uniref:hypothetical protein n=1 Tax=Paenibacillus oryzisoli TaxID=1850517 RepID=UPI003D2D5D48